MVYNNFNTFINVSYSNGKITPPVNVHDVQQALGSDSTDVATLCDSENINLWARYKPIRIPYKDNGGGVIDAQNMKALTNEKRRLWNYGVSSLGAYDANTDIFDMLFGSSGYGGILGGKTMEQVEQLVRTGFLTRYPVTPNVYFRRLSDFGQTGGVEGYNANATGQRSAVYKMVNGVETIIAQMAPPIFPEGQRDIEIDDSDTMVRFEVPNDTDFLDRFGWASENKDTENWYGYLDVANKCPDSLTSLETIAASRGSEVLYFKQSIQDEGYEVVAGEELITNRANAARGIVICKLGSNWEPVMSCVRNNIYRYRQYVTKYGQYMDFIATDMNDDQYFTGFSFQITNSICYVKGNSNYLSSTRPTEAEIRDWAMWLCFGEVDRTAEEIANAPAWFTEWKNSFWYSNNGLYGQNVYYNQQKRNMVLNRAMSIIRTVSNSKNSRYIDLALKNGTRRCAPKENYQTWTGAVHGTYNNAMFSEPTYNDIPDTLSGKLLVIEFYRRLINTSDVGWGDSAIIPSYAYFINIVRTEGGQGDTTIDIAGQLVFMEMIYQYPMYGFFARVFWREIYPEDEYPTVTLEEAENTVPQDTVLQSITESKFTLLGVKTSATRTGVPVYDDILVGDTATVEPIYAPNVWLSGELRGWFRFYVWFSDNELGGLYPTIYGIKADSGVMASKEFPQIPIPE